MKIQIVFMYGPTIIDNTCQYVAGLNILTKIENHLLGQTL